MMTQYRKGNITYNGSYIITDDNVTILNPTEKILLDNGYRLAEVEDNTLDKVIADKIAAIQAYDNSEAVNSFLLNGMPAWIEREDRLGTRRAIELDIENGHTESEVWLQGKKLVVNSQLALKLLDQLGYYAYLAYNVTQRHIYNVRQLTTIEEVNAYDYTQGYPKKLELSI
ncbi:DUF4376 domain-containing protein [Prevotella pallens]|jgi:hypothetical protein|uniref:DUF4376 domain-containing protein n=1 Tax=Prevotella pallens TaxID=60133 RepID=UPI0028DC586F|nr:DUF4376 domain-containing protein [Prevotella pallens]